MSSITFLIYNHLENCPTFSSVAVIKYHGIINLGEKIICFSSQFHVIAHYREKVKGCSSWSHLQSTARRERRECIIAQLSWFLKKKPSESKLRDWCHLLVGWVSISINIIKTIFHRCDTGVPCIENLSLGLSLKMVLP